MTMWIPDLTGIPGPRYKAIAEAIGRAVADGTLAAGARLPTHREMAYQLGCTVGTITRAYAEAARRGLVDATVGRGTYVLEPPDRAALLPAHQSPPGFTIRPEDGETAIDLSLIFPTIAQVHEAAYADAVAAMRRDGVIGHLLRYQPSAGLPPHRAAGARWMARSGLEASAERTVVTAGAQHAIDLVLSVLARPGDMVLCEDLTYPGVKALAAHRDIRLCGVPTDDEGLVPEALDEACRTHRPKALYCVPTLMNPTTATMSEDRRRAVAAVIRRHDLWTIEDDIYGLLPETRPDALAAHAPDKTFFVTSASKTMAPGLRLGWIHCPETMVDAIATALRVNLWMVAPPQAEIAARWIDDGTAEALLDWQRTEIAARHAIVAKELAGTPYRIAEGAFHFWLPLPAPWRGPDFVGVLRDRGVLALSAETNAVKRDQVPHAARLCIGAEPDRARLAQGLRIVKEALSRPPAADLAVV